MNKLKIKMPLSTRIGTYFIMPWVLIFYGIGGILGLISMLKDKTNLRVNKHYLRLMVGGWVIFGVSWVMPLRVIIIAKVVNEYQYIPKSLLNIQFNIGEVIKYDARGLEIYLETFGKGFRYIKCRAKDNRFTVDQFEWIK